MLQSDRGIRVFLATKLGPAALQILVKHVGVDHPEAWRLEAVQGALGLGHGARWESRQESVSVDLRSVSKTRLSVVSKRSRRPTPEFESE